MIACFERACKAAHHLFILLRASRGSVSAESEHRGRSERDVGSAISFRSAVTLRTSRSSAHNTEYGWEGRFVRIRRLQINLNRRGARERYRRYDTGFSMVFLPIGREARSARRTTSGRELRRESASRASAPVHRYRMAIDVAVDETVNCCPERRRTVGKLRR